MQYSGLEAWLSAVNTETGTIVSLVFDIPNRKITTLIAFSKGNNSLPVPRLLQLTWICRALGAC